ncbi:hypothetical protein Y032_0023g862 [Ancylostoma ceylanicum]|uniref:Uncharacterized protein n=1 Tax=Ancylostoma ceylanicum TaxID=53326 RepID=A0A016UY67_9BILA|nr:hypothetical protein Y032_0023g862 [Ancylostoma ceylanicum]
MREEIGDVQRFVASDEMVRQQPKEGRMKRQNIRTGAPLSVWYEKLKGHIWKEIEVGNGERIPHIFNICFEHVQDEWLKIEAAGPQQVFAKGSG